MMKFFRKHNRKLLAIFMAGLLVVWLGGSALNALLAPDITGRVVANTSLGAIEQRDQVQASAETGLLEFLRLPWRQPSSLAAMLQQEPLDLIDWILLTREAAAYGIAVQDGEVDEFLSNIGISRDFVQTLARGKDIKIESIRSAVGKLVALQRMVDLTALGAIKSEAEIRVQARDELEQARVNLVVLPAAQFVDPAEEFSEEEILAQFEKHKDENRDKGLSFGYWQAARVKVEYVVVDNNVIADNLRIGDATIESKAREYWEQNPKDNRFAIQIKDTDKQDSDDPTAPPPDPNQPKFTWPTKFEEARDKAILIVRKQFAAEEAEKIADWVLRQLVEPWYDVASGEDGYKIAPPGVMEDGYCEAVLERLPGKLHFGDAVRVERSEFFEPVRAHRVPGIGVSFVPLPGGGGYRFTQLAFQVQGVTPMPTDPQVDRSLFLAEGQWCPVVLKDGSENQYVFRTVDVKPAGPPDSVDEVREMVVADLHLLRGFDRASKAAERILAAAPAVGLEAAYKGDEISSGDAPRGSFVPPPPFARVRLASGNRVSRPEQTITGLGLVDRSFVERCLKLAEAPEGQRVAVVPLEQIAKVAVVQGVEVLPLRIDQYNAQRLQISNRMNRLAMAQAASDWLDPQQIRTRNGFAFATP